MAKVIQIAVSSAPDENGVDILYALRSDGTIWSIVPESKGAFPWRKIEPPPGNKIIKKQEI